MNKKLTATLCALLMLLGLTAGCGGNSTMVDLMKDYTKFFEIRTVDYVRLYQKDDGASYYKAL